LTSRPRSLIRCSFATMFFSKSTRLLARSAKDCHSVTSSSVPLQQIHRQKSTS
jgi:hypothetical protein